MINYHIRKNHQGAETGAMEHILLEELAYAPAFEQNTESAFAQCNGFIGVRAAHDFRVVGEMRGLFVGGLYQKATASEGTELINCPDILELSLTVGGEIFSLDRDLIQYRRSLNVNTGELVIDYLAELKNGVKLKIKTRRFASAVDRRLFCQDVEITLLSQTETELALTSGINGQVTNSGVSHFSQIDFRVYNKQVMEMKGKLQEDHLQILSGCRTDSSQAVTDIDFILGRRKMNGIYRYKLEPHQGLHFTKYSLICSAQTGVAKWETLQEYLKKEYETLYEAHCLQQKEVMRYAAIQIEGATLAEEAAIAFAQYHLLGMKPDDTTDYSIGAKGLTGEGYKGHVFWDVELFIQPFFLHLFPEVCRNLLIYRFLGLPGARAKAAQLGYQGAMFPWEAALSGAEETPLYAALNIHTGTANKVWSGIKEHHVTADIVYAIWNYYAVTGDDEFLREYGYEIVFETAAFWVSRASYHPKKKCFEILDVIGPDEYTEHINNNAYTNYLAWFNVKTALEFASQLGQEEVRRYQIAEKIASWRQFVTQIYLPQPNEDGIIPQDDTFLLKQPLKQLEKYKHSPLKQAVLLDYSRDEVVERQVCKQADVVMLLNLFPGLFEPEIVKKNVLFYESRTLHDSSLSYCAHAQACAAIGEKELAYQFFEQALEVDLSDNPHNSTDGIHSASLGGIWNCIFYGFAGVSFSNGKLILRPNLPRHWQAIEFYLKLETEYINIKIDKKHIVMTCGNPLQRPYPVIVAKKEYQLSKELCINL
jgi:hypothetical glycosyl hydrolase